LLEVVCEPGGCTHYPLVLIEDFFLRLIGGNEAVKFLLDRCLGRCLWPRPLLTSRMPVSHISIPMLEVACIYSAALALARTFSPLLT